MRPAKVQPVSGGHQTSSIECSVEGPIESTHFYRDGREIVPGSLDCLLCTLAMTDKGSVALYLNSPVNLSDSSSWTCLVLANGSSNKQSTSQMSYDSGPHLVLEVDGQEVAANEQISVRENEIINLKCVWKNSSTSSQLHWLVKDSNMTSSGRMSLDILGDGTLVIQSQLRLNATESLDKLPVTCIVVDPLSPFTVNKSAYLNILYKPSFYISRLPSFRTPVHEGMRVVLKCNVYANPSSTPKWYRETLNRSGEEASAQGESIELQTGENGELIFPSVQVPDSGWYRCRTENFEGNFSSTPYFLQVQSHSDRLQTSTPVASNIRAPNQPLEMGTNSNYTSSIINQCTGIPKVEQPIQLITSSIGRHVTLSMRFCCQPRPLRVFWIHRHLALIPGHLFGPYIAREIYNIYNSFYCYESTFEIEAFRPEDVGTVYGFVSNERGHAGAQFHLQFSSSIANGLGKCNGMDERSLFNCSPVY